MYYVGTICEIVITFMKQHFILNRVGIQNKNLIYTN